MPALLTSRAFDYHEYHDFLKNHIIATKPTNNSDFY